MPNKSAPWSPHYRQKEPKNPYDCTPLALFRFNKNPYDCTPFAGKNPYDCTPQFRMIVPLHFSGSRGLRQVEGRLFFTRGKVRGIHRVPVFTKPQSGEPEAPDAEGKPIGFLRIC